MYSVTPTEFCLFVWPSEHLKIYYTWDFFWMVAKTCIHRLVQTYKTIKKSLKVISGEKANMKAVNCKFQFSCCEYRSRHQNFGEISMQNTTSVIQTVFQSHNLQNFTNYMNLLQTNWVYYPHKLHNPLTSILFLCLKWHFMTVKEQVPFI